MILSMEETRQHRQFSGCVTEQARDTLGSALYCTAPLPSLYNIPTPFTISTDNSWGVVLGKIAHFLELLNA